MSAFPILRLPFLAAKIVVNGIEVSDLTALFVCSKKTQQLIKSLHKSVSFLALSLEQKKSLTVLEIIELFREEKREGKFLKEYTMNYGINVSDDIGFELNVEFGLQLDETIQFYVFAKCVNRQDQYEGTKQNLKIDDVTVPVVMTNKDIIYTIWPDRQKGFETIGKYLEQKSTSSSFNLYINVGKELEFSEDLRFVINWMNSTNYIPNRCAIHNQSNNKISEDDFNFIFDNVHPTKGLNISLDLGDQFQCNTSFKSESLHLTHANWFTLENLLKTDCELIHFQESKLTNNDLKEYLKQWMTGKFTKLRNLVVIMQEDLNIDVILSALEDSEEHITITRKHNKVLLKRDDGRVVEISTRGWTPRRFGMNIQFL